MSKLYSYLIGVLSITWNREVAKATDCRIKGTCYKSGVGDDYFN